MIKLSHFDRTFATHFLNIDAFNDTIQSVKSTSNTYRFRVGEADRKFNGLSDLK